jgi:glycosyltransferase involved in cell wall biosynthesis
MQINKPEIIFTFPAIMGGVASFNFNIINNSSLLKHFYSKVILMHEVSDNRPLFTEQFNTDEQIKFEYSDKENQFHLQKRLNILLGNNNGAIVTDNGLTMEAANRFCNPKTIISLLHDYYYVNQQIKLDNLADVAIAHSSFFSDAVFASNPVIWENRTFYIPYGVKQFTDLPQKKEGDLNLVFLGRLEEEKGVLKLFEIEKGLQQLGILVHWTIIGKGILKQQLIKQWEGRTTSFFEPETSDEVYELLKSQDMFIFPTVFEGTPVSILESLSAGVVPITHDLPGGIRDIVTDEIGYRCKIGAVSDFIEKIRTLHNDRSLLKKMQHNCFALAHGSYDVNLNADKYFDFFLKYGEMRRKQKSEPRNLVKLDSPIFLNSISTFIRSLK